MAVEKWRWPVIAGNQPVQVNNRVRTVQFGDGYAQNAAEGVNPNSLTVPISWTGTTAEGKEMVSFLTDHTSTPFSFVPPAGVLGLYRTKPGSVSYNQISRHVMTVQATLEQSFGTFGGTRG